MHYYEQYLEKAPDYVLPDPLLESYLCFTTPIRPRYDYSEECYRSFYVSTPEIAEFLHMTRIAIYKRIRAGKLKATMIGGCYMVSLYDLEKHLDRALNIYDFVDIRERRELANIRQACYNPRTT